MDHIRANVMVSDYCVFLQLRKLETAAFRPGSEGVCSGAGERERERIFEKLFTGSHKERKRVKKNVFICEL